MDSCIFCKIVRGEIPSYKVYEDDDVLAFLDITQVTPGHTLIIPKQHVTDIFELSSELAGKIFAKVPKISQQLKEALSPIGLNVVNNNQAPLQSVFHYHIHLIPRYPNDGFVLSFSGSPKPSEKLKQTLDQINKKA